MTPSLRALGCTLPLVLALSGCELIDTAIQAAGVTVALEGEVSLSGNVDPSEVSLDVTLYRLLENSSSFRTAACQEAGRSLGDCFGAVEIENLRPEDAVSGAVVSFSPTDGRVRITGVPADFGYLVVAQARADGAQCGNDLLGLEEETKLVTRASMVSPLRNLSDARSTTARFPRSLNLRCDRRAVGEVDEENIEPPVVRPPADPETPEVVTDEIPDAPDTAVSWTTFRLLDKDGALLADASSQAVAGRNDLPPCGSSRPMRIQAALEGGAAVDRAWLHVQEGRGEGARTRDLEIPVRNGQIEDHLVQLSGGFARLQLDTSPWSDTDGSGASRVIEICDPTTPPTMPAQEFLMVTSWNTNNTDVDGHVWVTDAQGVEEHVFYGNRQGRNAELDVDNVTGFGPETITSRAQAVNLRYDARLHFFSDRNSSERTDVTVRILYANAASGVRCDMSVIVRDFQNRAWENIATFSPDLRDLADSNPQQFERLGCRLVSPL